MKISIIGSGFSSLAASCYLAKMGYDVTIFEKNTTIGGRARQLKKNGFTFDIGPTWYWMPDVFERFFSDFDKYPSDYYQLEKLNPAYSVYFGVDDYITIEDTLEKIITASSKVEALVELIFSLSLIERKLYFGIVSTVYFRWVLS